VDPFAVGVCDVSEIRRQHRSGASGHQDLATAAICAITHVPCGQATVIRPSEVQRGAPWLLPGIAVRPEPSTPMIQ
jgi:hypothetical protein